MRRMKNFDEILRGIPSAGTKNRAETMRSSANQGYEFYTDLDGTVIPYDLPSEERAAIAEPPKDITVDNSISEALMRLSLTDRNEIEEEVHGIVREPEETPEFLNWCLREFDKELMIVKNSKERLRHIKAHEDVLRNVIRTDFSHVEDGISDSESTIDSSGPLESRSDLSDNAGSNSYQSKSSCYVNDRKVRLRFIRAERYNCKKAVKRFVNFLSFAKELYGDFVADRPIQLSDLKTRKEKWALSNVSFQFLPFRDRSGRRVFVSVGSCGYDIEPCVRIKILWYMYWIASEDIESQQKGVVIIGWPSDSAISQSDDETNGSDGYSGGGSVDSENNVWEDSLRQNLVVEEGIYQSKALDGLPLRIAALHVCFEDRPIYRLLNSLFHFAMNPYLKARYKVHIGEPLEIRYKLQGFGIPTDSLPLTHTMALKRQNHTQWIALRKRIERIDRNQEGNSTKSSGGKCKKVTTPSTSLPFNPDDLVECPRSYDVIIGKAKYQNNPGNVFYRSLIEATHDEHISSSKREKVELTWRIVRQMEKRKGRFLEMNKSLKAWVHIKDRNVMRQKVAQSFKEYKRNAGVVRSKRNLDWHNNRSSSSSPRIPGKRIKTVVNPMFENDCFTGCFSGFDCEKTNDFVVTPDENSSDLVVSRSAFASLW